METPSISKQPAKTDTEVALVLALPEALLLSKCFYVHISLVFETVKKGPRRQPVMRREGVLVFLLFVGLSMGLSSSQLGEYVVMKAGAVELPPMSLVAVGASGIEVVLNETAISEMPFYRGYGGFKNQLGNLKGWGNYTGVSLSTLCDSVGGLTSTGHVKIVAADGYSVNLTFAEVNGDFVTYDSAGVEVPRSQPLVPIVAYHFNDLNISSSDGPMRLAIVGPEGLATDSIYWVKMVNRVEVVDDTIPKIPEFRSSRVLFALLLVVLGVVVSLRAWYQRQQRVDSNGQ